MASITSINPPVDLAAVRSNAMARSVAVDSAFIVDPTVCWVFVFFPSLVIKYLFLFLILQTSRWGREGWLVYFNFFLVSRDCYVLCLRAVSLPLGTVGWSKGIA